MSLTGLLVTLVTFPGVIVHEFAHEKACDRLGVPVLEVCYFRLGSPAGYVQHAEPASYRTGYAISVAPFLVNTVLAAVAFAGIALLANGAGGVNEAGTAGWVLLWLGLSIAAHAFPSTGDAKSIWSGTKANYRSSPFALIGLPIAALIYVANLLSILWFDVVYALALYVAVAMMLPGFLLQVL